MEALVRVWDSVIAQTALDTDVQEVEFNLEKAAEESCDGQTGKIPLRGNCMNTAHLPQQSEVWRGMWILSINTLGNNNREGKKNYLN